MASVLALLTIEIGIDPEIQEFGGLLLTWHGVFTAVGIAAGVYVAVLIGRRLGFIDDDAYSAALVGIPCAIVGARALFVVERWGEAGLDNWVDAFRINEGGISIYGAVIGGLIGGIAYGWVRKLPLRRGLDGASFGLILGMGIGRIGDIINGEHFAEVSSLPWAVRYTNLNSPSVLSEDSPCGLNPLLGLSTDNLPAPPPPRRRRLLQHAAALCAHALRRQRAAHRQPGGDRGADHAAGHVALRHPARPDRAGVLLAPAGSRAACRRRGARARHPGAPPPGGHARV